MKPEHETPEPTARRSAEISAGETSDGGAIARAADIDDLAALERWIAARRAADAPGAPDPGAASGFLSDFARLSGVGGWIFDDASRSVFWTKQARLIHAAPPNFEPDLHTALAFYPPEDRRALRRAAARSVTSGGFLDVELRLSGAAGARRWVHIFGMPVYQQGRFVRLVGAIRDVTDRRDRIDAFKRAEYEAEAARTRLWLAIDAIQDGFAIYDGREHLVIANQRYRDLYEQSAPSMVPGATFEEIILYGLAHGQYPEAEGRVDDWLDERLKAHRSPQALLELKMPGDRYVQVRDTVAANGDRVGVRTDITGIRRAERRLRQYASELAGARDLAEQRAAELESVNARIRRLSLEDSLTALPNRRHLDEHLATLTKLAATPAGAKMSLGLLHLDLDRFKQINDTLGHAVGDLVLRHVANVLRAKTGPDDFIARIGGDEFIIACAWRGASRYLMALADRLIAALNQPVAIEDVNCRLGASIGVACGPLAHVDRSDLMIHADIALYRAKRDGRSRVAAFTSAMQRELSTRKRAADDIHTGLETGAFIPFYQPQFDAKTLEMTGVEALARWRLPDGRIAPPAAFLDVATEIGAIADIDAAIMAQAADDLMRFDAAGLTRLRCSINVSAKRLSDASLLPSLKALRAPLDRLSFELVETIFLDDPEADVVWTLDQLAEAGIEIELDDFGTGHASILSLTKIKPKRLKIDRQLVEPITRSPEQSRLIAAIVQMSCAVGIEVVAEGVETFEHAAMLRDLGCTLLQGYAFAKPMPADEIAPFWRGRGWIADASAATG